MVILAAEWRAAGASVRAVSIDCLRGHPFGIYLRVLTSEFMSEWARVLKDRCPFPARVNELEAFPQASPRPSGPWE